jgi:GT2 family glycosyltransferase
MNPPAAEIRRRLGAPASPAWTPRVSLIVVNRNGAPHLRRLLAGLVDCTDYPRLELILVDNDSEDRSLDLVRRAEAPFPVSIVANHHNESFSDACNRGAAEAQGELLLFLNNDVEPFEQGWLLELVACLEGNRPALVGATLIRPDERSVHGYAVQHRAMRLREVDGQMRADLHGADANPLGPALGEDAETPIAAGACMLVSRELFERVGGFTRGFLYGGEDVDLGLKVLDAGGSVVCSGRSLLIHRLGSTRAREDRERLQARRAANRRLLWEHWGPRLRREYELDRLAGGGFWATPGEGSGAPPTREQALALGFCLRSSEPAAEGADPLERLRAELARRGHRCVVLRGEAIDDLGGFDHDVAVHLRGPARYAPRPSQLNVLWAPGSLDRVPALERDRYHLASDSEDASALLDAILALAERSAFPTRIGNDSRPRPAPVRSAT